MHFVYFSSKGINNNKSVFVAASFLINGLKLLPTVPIKVCVKKYVTSYKQTRRRGRACYKLIYDSKK